MHRGPSLLARVGCSGAAAGALLLAAAACGGDGVTGPTADAAGRYEIVQVNDDVTPPFLLLEEVSQGSTVRVEIVSGVFDLRRDGEYSSVGRVRLTFDGEVTEETAATR